MKYNQPFGVSDPNAVYINGNASTGEMGSVPPAASIEYPQREIVNFIADSGLTPDNGDLRQLSRSVQSGAVIFGIDSGPVNALSVGLSPPLLAYTEGLSIWVLVNNTNTGAATLAVNALAPKNIVRRGGGALQAGDLPGGYKALLNYNALHSNFEYYGASYSAISGIPALAANTNLYVNTTTGNDTTLDGTQPTVAAPHGPFKTIGRAIAETFKYGPSIYTMTINISAGTYNEAVATPTVVGPTAILKGAGAGLTFVTTATLPGLDAISAKSGNTMFVRDLCATTGALGGGSPSCFVASSGATIITNDTASGNSSAYIFTSYGGYFFPGNHTFNAGTSCLNALWSVYGGFLQFQASTTFTHAGAFTCSAYAAASANGVVSCGPPSLPVFGNAAGVSGLKFSATLNGVVTTGGQGPAFYPGSIAGTTGSGGQYN